MRNEKFWWRKQFFWCNFNARCVFASGFLFLYLTTIPKIQYIFFVDLLDIALSSIEFLTYREKSLVRKKLSCADELCSLSKEDMSILIGRRIKSDSWDGRRCLALAERSFSIIEKFGIRAISSEDNDFPPMLKEIFDPPYIIFARGDIKCLEKKCVSVVGTRRVCSVCAQSTYNFSAECASNGLTVVSGLAYGVDTYAHRGALSVENGLTAAVLPCGIDTVVPYGNARFASKILDKGGVLVSEYVPGSPAEAWRFVKRNRLIAALSSVVTVTQAPPGSGALITADFALGYNRYLAFHGDCFCPEAKLLTEKTVAALLAKNTRAASEKIQRSCENFVMDGAPVFKDYKEFCNILRDVDGVQQEKKLQPEMAF